MFFCRLWKIKVSTSRFQAGCHHRPGPRWVHLHLGHDRGSACRCYCWVFSVSLFIFFCLCRLGQHHRRVVNLSRVYIGWGANVTATFTWTPIHLAGCFAWLIKPKLRIAKIFHNSFLSSVFSPQSHLFSPNSRHLRRQATRYVNNDGSKYRTCWKPPQEVERLCKGL